MKNRALFSTAATMPVMPRPLSTVARARSAVAKAGPWPFPRVGKPLTWKLDKDGVATVSMTVKGGTGTIVGCVVVDNVVIDPGKSYTPEEWKRVGTEVNAFLARRSLGTRL